MMRLSPWRNARLSVTCGGCEALYRVLSIPFTLVLHHDRAGSLREPEGIVRGQNRGHARYIQDDETCRQLLLMEYFGQKEEKACGICDVCIGKKKRLQARERKSLEEQILQLLAERDVNVRELVRLFGERRASGG